MEIASAIAPGNPVAGPSSAGSDDSRSADDPFLALLAGMLAGFQAQAAPAMPTAPPAAGSGPAPSAAKPAAVPPAPVLGDDAAMEDELPPEQPPQAALGTDPILTMPAASTPECGSEVVGEATPQPSAPPVERKPSQARASHASVPAEPPADDEAPPAAPSPVPGATEKPVGTDRAPADAESRPDTPDAPARSVDTPPADPAGVRLRTATGDTPPPAEPARLSPPVPLAVPDHRGRQVTARLVIGGAGGTSSVRIELEPADLGRIEVALRLGDGGAAASFTVDRPETLQLLQRDARTVTDMLSAAGFSVDSGSLGFSLRDGGGNAGQPERPHFGPAAGGSASAEIEPGARAVLRHGLLDLRV